MNKCILVVLKWLDDPNSVSQEERAKNRRKATCAYWTACAAYAATYDEAYAHAAYGAAHAAYASTASVATYWIKEYFKETGEDKDEYLKELEK